MKSKIAEFNQKMRKQKASQKLIKTIGLKSDKQIEQLLKLIQMIDDSEENLNTLTQARINDQVVTYLETK